MQLGMKNYLYYSIKLVFVSNLYAAGKLAYLASLPSWDCALRDTVVFAQCSVAYTYN